MTTLRPATRVRYQAHPRAGDVARRERQLGEWELSLVARAAVAGVILAGFLFVLPFLGLVLGAALGIDAAVLP